MRVLGIETTCDETACAVVEDGARILSSVVSSSIDLHIPFQGVVPELACRRHVEVFLPVLEQTLNEADLQLDDVDVIAVAQGPGLMGALLIGLNAAKALAMAAERPFVGVNHVEAHLYAAMMGRLHEIQWPAVGLVVSGGHTALCLIEGVGRYRLLGSTVDDAVGEAFDKVSVLLGTGYPGGPKIEAMAKSGNPKRFALSAGRVKGQPLDFSFSGLKTAVLYAAKGQDARNLSAMSEPDKADLAAAFQEVALGDLVRKTLLACEQVGARSIVVGGGVSCNQRLRELLAQEAGERRVFWPAPGLSTDNAAMIAGLGYHIYQRQQKGCPFDLEASPQLPWY
jgi:N6-L-threonylcarbamoyladenine synthase